MAFYYVPHTISEHLLVSGRKQKLNIIFIVLLRSIPYPPAPILIFFLFFPGFRNGCIDLGTPAQLPGGH